MPKASPTPTRPRLPLWKKLAFSALVTLLFFLALELVLMLVGVRPLLYDEDPHVGFTSHVPLYVEKSAGRMITAPNKLRWFNEQQFARRKPDGVTRVFCVGGSTTYGRPYTDTTSFCGWLREYLPAADPSRSWEVVNAGGISYASYRVAKVMEELVAYEPDLFIVYSGHNEFLEERTYSGIIETPAAVRGMQSILSHTRTYSAVSNLLRPRQKKKESNTTPVLAAEVSTILDQSAGLDRYTRDSALEEKIIAHYRYNLSRMVDVAQSAKARILFVVPGSNLRNASPFKSEASDSLSEAQKQDYQKHFSAAQAHLNAQRHNEALAAMDQAIAIDAAHAHGHFLRAQSLLALGRDTEAATSYEQALRQDICPLRILPSMRDLLMETASARGVPSFDYQALLNDKAEHGIPGEDWFLDHVHPTIEGHRELALALIDTMETQGFLANKSALNENTIAAIKKRVMANVDDHARGIALRNLGNVLNWAGKKREAYQSAKKALALAPGDAYAHYLAGSLARELGERDEAITHLSELTRFKLDVEEAPYFPDAHYQLAQALANQGNGGESARLLAKTLELKPDHAAASEALPRVLEQHGKNLLKARRPAEAAQAFRELRKVSPQHPLASNFLAVALIQDTKFTEAITVLTDAVSATPGNPSLHNNLGTAYARTKQPEEAAKHFKLAVQYQPGHSGAHLNLARLLESSDREQAATHYRAVLKLKPDSKEALEGLQRMSIPATE